jgi:hypothetical protein
MALSAVVLAALSGCSTVAEQSESETAASSPSSAAAVVAPLPTSGGVDYQLGGGYKPAPGVTIVARDSTDEPATGLYNICYVNGFQTQPGEDGAFWLTDHPELLVRTADGEPLVDEGWPDEFLLDTSSESGRDSIAEILTESIVRCATSDYDAVEFDNLDSFSRSGSVLTLENNLALATKLVAIAHTNGLAAGQKNTAELGARGRDEAGFDFEVSESCHLWDECAVYTEVYGTAVLNIEYVDELRGSIDDVCAAPSLPPLTVIRDHNLTTPGSEDYAFFSCEA